MHGKLISVRVRDLDTSLIDRSIAEYEDGGETVTIPVSVNGEQTGCNVHTVVEAVTEMAVIFGYAASEEGYFVYVKNDFGHWALFPTAVVYQNSVEKLAAGDLGFFLPVAELLTLITTDARERHEAGES